MTLRGLVRLSAFPLLLAAAGIACSNNNSNPCVTAPEHSPSDLACNSDGDCTTTWSGTVCCGCSCPDAPANNAAKARDQDTLSSVFNQPHCSRPSCECPATSIARCVAHQCVLCGLFGTVPGQPAACDEDAGGRDAGVND